DGLLREAPGQRDRRLGIVRLAQVVEDLAAGNGAKLGLERRQELRVVRLLAAVRAEARGDQRRRRDDVVRRIRLDRDPRLREVRVDPGDVRLQELPVGRSERGDLPREKALRLRARGEYLAREGERDRIQPGRVDRSDACGAANQVEEQPAV